MSRFASITGLVASLVLSQVALAQVRTVTKYKYYVEFTCTDCGEKKYSGPFSNTAQANQSGIAGVRSDPKLIFRVVPKPYKGYVRVPAPPAPSPQRRPRTAPIRNVAKVKPRVPNPAQRLNAKLDTIVPPSPPSQPKQRGDANRRLDKRLNQVARNNPHTGGSSQPRASRLDGKLNQVGRPTGAAPATSEDFENRMANRIRQIAQSRPHDSTPDVDPRARLNRNLKRIRPLGARQHGQRDNGPGLKDRLNNHLTQLAANTLDRNDPAAPANLLDRKLSELGIAGGGQSRDAGQGQGSGQETPAARLSAKLDEVRREDLPDEIRPHFPISTLLPKSEGGPLAEAEPAKSTSAETAIDDLRRAQQAELDALRDDIRQRAQQAGVNEQDLLGEYKQQMDEIRGRYNELDTRNQRVDGLLERTGAENTGSPTKDVRADVDTAGTAEVNERVLQEMTNSGHQLEVTDSKIVNHTDDHVHWRESTPAGEAEKARDPDSYKTTRGREAVGNSGEVTDARGEMIDHRSKFEHARADGDLKTGGKGLVKSVDAANGLKHDPHAKIEYEVQARDPDTGRPLYENGKPVMETRTRTGGYVPLSPQEKRIYQQAADLKAYGDSVTAGIANPGDTPDVENRKVGEWFDRAQDVIDKAQEVGNRRGDLRDQVRQNFAGSYDQAQPFDPDHRAANQNARAAIESDRAQVRESNKVGQAFLDGEIAKPTSDTFHSGGWKDGGIPADADARTRGGKAARPRADVAGAFDLAAQLGRGAVEQATEAAAEGRELNAGDVLGALDKSSGASGMYNMAHGISREEQLRVERGEQGQAAALGRTGARVLDKVARTMINDPVQQAIREEEAQAAREGRDPSYLRSSFNGAAHIGGELTGMNAAFEALNTASHLENHAAAGAQRKALKQFIQSERNLTNKRLDNAWRGLEQARQQGGDPAAMQAALKRYQSEFQRLQRFDDAADKFVGVNNKRDPYGMLRREAAGRMGADGKGFETRHSDRRLSPEDARAEFGGKTSP